MCFRKPGLLGICSVFHLVFCGFVVAQVPNSPSDIAASDGVFTSNVEVTWNFDTGGSTPVASFSVYRSITNQFCPGTPIATGIGAAERRYVDNTAVQGQIYYYSVRSISTGGIPSNCLESDSGFAGTLPTPRPPTNLTATNDLAGKILLQWELPTGSQPIDYFAIYRSFPAESFCQGEPIATVDFDGTSFEDTTADSDKNYWYSIKSFGPTGPEGQGQCSETVPGRQVLPPPPIPPADVSASDGTYPDKVMVTWLPPDTGGAITGYTLHRTTDPDAPGCSSEYQSGLLNQEPYAFEDNSVIPGVIYYYSMESEGPAETSICSNVDPGFAITVCSDGKDNDGDGLADYPNDPGCTGLEDDNENDDNLVCDNGIDDDGDELVDFQVEGGDPGCESPTDNTEDDSSRALQSPVFAKFNTFLGQWNFAELINQGTVDKIVAVTIHNLRGEVMITRSYVVPPGEQVDVDVNGLVDFACDVLNQNCDGFQDLSETTGAPNGIGRPDGVVDTYGLVRFDFDDSDPKERLLGRMSFYRPNTDGSFSFAFARQLVNPSKGITYATSNCFDPSGQGYIVPNWAEVISLGVPNGDETVSRDLESFTLNIYMQDGQIVSSTPFQLSGLSIR